jgi:putative ABC transport system permease protein
VIADLSSNKTRTLLIVLSIAVGLFALGTIISARTILSTDMDAAFATINPSSGIVRTTETFDAAFVRAIRDMSGVADVSARRVVEARIEVSAGTWENIRIFAVEDYESMKVDIIRPESGAWPPPEREILIERSAVELLEAQRGHRMRVELPGDRERELRVAGLAHDLIQVPAQFDGTPYGYVSMETLAWLGLPYGFNELHIVVDPPDDAGVELKAHTQGILNEVKDRVERNGMTIPLTLSAEPGALPLDDILQAILLLLGALGLLALFLSVFLIINTVSALLAQQRRQIGAMKAIGASGLQISHMYLVLVIFYGLSALALAAPLGTLGARALSHFLAGQFNFNLTDIQIPAYVIAIQAGVGVLVPVLASFYPLLNHLNVTAAEAISDLQLGKGRFGTGLIDHLLAGANLWFARRFLRRPLLLSLRNTFRSKGRLLLTLITLTMAGAIFVGVFSVRASLSQTIDELLQWWGFDLWVAFSQPYRVERVNQTVGQVPQVAQTDIWLTLPMRRVRDDGSESDSIFLFAPRVGSELVPPPAMTEGRWLLPEDDNAVVVSAIFLKDEPDIEIGDTIVIKLAGREQEYQVVGVCLGVIAPIAYAPYDYVARTTGHTGQAGAVLVRGQWDDSADVVEAAALDEMISVLEPYLESQGLRVGSVQTVVAEKSEAQASLGIIIALLLVMAVLLAIVGGLGLMGTMSINVLERTREIGVLRAIGASTRGVAKVFIFEGIMIGVMSWGLGSVLALPLGELLSDAVGIPLMGTPLTFVFSFNGMWIWLGVVIVLSALASFLPARNAAQLTVREVLAYE